ncbi:glycosyltransferase, MGT family [Clostridium acidisoli DSM 12555]|uniref:Glycosyltransferase, MGT family n=1 Tax=Clostridium acidisoli DSM 12555 TaxID=1121291 RepID=A0A1W1X3A7_9CLOT|nr:macrolide family glycosyltransferase [Clostridium acidisoli]SMC18367.1 glycosyltransferase, MGT family [Clostridium acidisoli DSM 12555]
MSNVLFFNIPAHGHINPTLGLVDELIREGENVAYFCTEEFKTKIEKTGATFMSYTNFRRDEINRKKGTNINDYLDFINKDIDKSQEIINEILDKIKNLKFDYIIHSSMFPYANIIAQILKLPTVSSFAIFATPKELMSKEGLSISEEQIKNHPMIKTYERVAHNLEETYNITMPNLIDMYFNNGDINIAYTSKYFITNPKYYNDNFIFIGPPIYNRKENLDFPFEKLKDKKVIYISLGTVFNNTDNRLYDIFFKSFGGSDVVVVMAAYNVDLSSFDIPKNFIVRNYVPQSEILKYTDVAITHAGMNSTNDLLYNNIPFVAIPIGADQPYMAKRASELGAAISLDKDKLTPEILKNSVKKVLTDPSYINNIKKISSSFKLTGGYKKAVEEISKLKKEKGIFA